MSSEPLYGELDIPLSPSVRLITILGMAHAGAWGCVLSLPVDWVVRAGLVVSVGCGLLMYLPSVALLRGPRAVIRLRWARDGEWTLWDGDGRVGVVPVGRGLLVHPWVTILEFRYPDDRRRRVVVMSDSADRDLHRKLNVRLRSERVRS